MKKATYEKKITQLRASIKETTLEMHDYKVGKADRVVKEMQQYLEQLERQYKTKFIDHDGN